MAAFSICIRCSLYAFLVTGGGKFIAAQKLVSPLCLKDANTDRRFTSGAPPPLPPRVSGHFATKSFRYNLKLFRYTHEVVFATTFESVRYKDEPKILKVTNLRYFINLFAHNPHMREPNSFAIVDEYMSNSN